jgi:hypothetical protein
VLEALPVGERTPPRRAGRHDDPVAIKITAHGAHARTKLNREILDPDTLHDVSLPQIVLQAIKAQTAGPKLATLAKHTSTLTPKLTTVLTECLLALHTHPTLRCDLTRTRLQQPGTSKRRAQIHPRSNALIGGDPLTQLTRAQLRRGRNRQRQTRIETDQHPVFVGRRAVATQMPRRQRAKPAAAQMTLHPILVRVIRQHPKRRVQPLTANVVRVLHAMTLWRRRPS